ncbi:ABC transporter substrate-binding protein, partial [Methylobacterium trifolii]|uniref:ABC transporter substrate-binding protein n=1 Tax=Methylobacterium trifolii TaxID=1003092 RepID=UPI001EDEFC41
MINEYPDSLNPPVLMMRSDMIKRNFEDHMRIFMDFKSPLSDRSPHWSTHSISRRNIFTLLALFSAGIPMARSQERKGLVIGYLGSELPESYASRLKAFRAGLEAAGFVEGQNLAIQFRWAAGKYDQLSALAQDLVEQNVSLIVAAGGASVALAAKKATTSLPIVFELGGDPVALGLVDSLARPGGNLTGISSLSVEVSSKRLEFMHKLLPHARNFIVVGNPKSPTSERQITNLRETAGKLEIEIDIQMPNSEASLEAIVTDFSPAHAAG